MLPKPKKSNVSRCLQIIASGAGAALALDFVAFVRANQLMSRRPTKVFYSSASLALLQFVTNTLLAEATPGIEIKTALTRHDDLEVSVSRRFTNFPVNSNNICRSDPLILTKSRNNILLTRGFPLVSDVFFISVKLLA